MIYIEKEASNYFPLTLTESSAPGSIGFVFKFIFEVVTEQPFIYFITDDISTSPIRYNEFLLEESSTGSKTGGINVPLNLLYGQYEYRVYDYFEPFDDIEDVVVDEANLIEVGRMLVVGEDNDRPEIFD